MKHGIEDFFNFPGFLAVDNNWRGWCYVLSWEGIGGCIFEEGDVEHGVNFHGWWEYWFVGEVSYSFEDFKGAKSFVV